MVYEKAKLICEELLLLASEINNDEVTDRLFELSTEIMLIAKRECDASEKESR